MQVTKYTEEDALDELAYILFYVKRGSSPWFTGLLKKESKEETASNEEEANMKCDSSEACTEIDISCTDIVIYSKTLPPLFSLLNVSDIELSVG